MKIENNSKTALPKIVKALSIFGKTLELKNVELGNAEFILALRLDAKKSLHLSPTSNRLADQQKWIESYVTDAIQAYFVILHNSEPIGTVRLYDAIEDSFCWGSWILNDRAPVQAAIETTLIVYTFAFKVLGFNKSHFDVRKVNTKVYKFHERLGAKIVSEDDENYYYSIDNEEAFSAMKRYKKYLDCDLKINWL